MRPEGASGVHLPHTGPIGGAKHPKEAGMTEIIVALDGLSYQEAEEKKILDHLAKARAKGMIWGVKINDMLYTGDAARILSDLNKVHGLGVLADVKLHDIPSSIENTLSRLVAAGASIVTVHCAANYRPKDETLAGRIAGVTGLTSFTDLEVKWIYDKNAGEVARAFGDIALMNRYGYVMSSVKGLGYFEENPLKKICTGIRPHWHPYRDDQVRVASVKDAVRSGADYIVIGRPVIDSGDIPGAIEKIYSETT
jgi:orotidine-5'-phosphate decarboxylase